MGWFQLIEAFLQEREAFCVLLTTRPQLEVVENTVFRHANLVSSFHEVRMRSKLYWTTARHFEPRLELDTDRLFMQHRKDPEGLGRHRPDVLVLGEVQNRNASIPWPFATRCGIELVWPVLSLLPVRVRVSNSGPSEWRTGVANPFEDLHQRWTSMGRPPVVALGKQTEINCRMADVPIGTALPHPQWHLRFKAQEPETYHRMLKAAILSA
jgi:hypothetical protein